MTSVSQSWVYSPTMPITPSDIAHLRLRNQRIAGAGLGTPAEVVAWLGAVQAQDYSGAKWALGQRMQAATDADLDRAFASGQILRTHLMRPTWHFVTPSDIRWLLALTAPRVHAANAYMYRKLEVDAEVAKRSNAALETALQGGQQLTRDELREVLRSAGFAVDDGVRMAYFLMQAELDALICSGPRRGKQFTYALLEERAPQAKLLDRDEALAELAGRYFASRGPATVHDFAKWSGLTIAEARQGLEAVKSRLQLEVVDGRAYWHAPSTSAVGVAETSPTAYLLSIYDEYISGYKDRSAIGTAEVGAELSSMGNDLSYLVVVDGQIVGTWKRTLGKDAVGVELNLLTPLSDAASEAVAVTARRYGQFHGLPVVLS